jgi:hypothetical protein
MIDDEDSNIRKDDEENSTFVSHNNNNRECSAANESEFESKINSTIDIKDT